MLSRFRPDSQLSALNRSGALDAGPDLVAVTRLAARGPRADRRPVRPHRPRRPRGRGLRPHVRRGAPSRDGAAGERRCRGEVRIEGSRIELEPGFRLDLGGIAKGYAVDRALAHLSAAGPCLVNAGGDLAGSGRLWPVGVETADGELTLGLENGALATSGRDRRRWQRNGQRAPPPDRPRDRDRLRRASSSGSPSSRRPQSTPRCSRRRPFSAPPVDAPAVFVTTDGRTLLTGGLG